ncbi:LicD family protein [Lachnospiraceae bacterium]|nr:LicD family protein [Lachnospiraceae bacterium]
MVKIEGALLKKLQMTELEMMIEVDRICHKHNICYSLDGGTLLGAIRHNGFIPWDDDADIVMLRDEYEKFYQVCKKELDTERFFLQDYRTDKNYLWGYSKMRRNHTVFLREGQEHVNCHTGVCIDIFVYDNVPDGWLVRRLHLFLCYLIRKGLYARVGKKNADSVVMRKWFCIISKIPRNFWFKQIGWLAGITNRKESCLVRHMTYPYRKQCRYGLPRKCFDEYMDKDFEGHNFRIFKDYDLYLSRLYGNYMELPPPEKRKIHPASRVELPI